jgi:aminoglycoside phosphotransferase (APT) family kinase protein
MGSSAGIDPPDPDAVRAALAAAGEDPGPIDLSEIEGGASRQTFLVAARGEPRWVIRREPAAGMSFNSLEVELAAIAAADLAGVAVAPTVRFEPAGGRFGAGAGYAMEFVAGTSVAPRVLRRDDLAGARERLPEQLAAALAQTHSVEPGAVEGLAGGEGDPALEACELWEAELDTIGEPLPAIEAGLRWLRLNAPPAATPRLVHGDFRLGNVIVNEHGLAAVIDWELCHAGDPVEDLAWLCIRSWRFGNDGLPVAGVGELEPFLAAYVSAGGIRPDPDRWRWWSAMGNVKWAVICARQAHDHLTGARPSAELASLGRRICEPEWDLLELLPAASSAPRPGAAGSGPG